MIPGISVVRKNVIAIAICMTLTTVYSGCTLEEAELPEKPTITGAIINTNPETTVTLTASAKGATSFLWKRDGMTINGQSTSSLIVSVSGSYTVAGINKSGRGILSDPHYVTIVNPPIAGFTYTDNLDVFYLASTSTGEITDYQWHVSGDQQVRIVSPKAKITALELPSVTTTVEVSLTVTNNWGTSTASQNIELPPLTFYRKYGLGRDPVNEASNNVDYVWYMDQQNTGVYWSDNCGPTCATMAIKWVNRYFTKTPEDARNAYLPEGGWWYTSNIIDYLSDNNTAHYVAALVQLSDLVSKLDNGNIVTLCLDMYYVRSLSGNPEWRIDKFYTTNAVGWGHFIIVKGYKKVDDIVWLEVYDPWSLGQKYNDGTLKGLDRYYRSEDILRATYEWWSNMIVIDNPANPAIRLQAIDPSTIVHQRGR